MSELMLSFDIEDWFHAHNMRPAITRAEWDARESRVEQSTERILDLLDGHGTSATFFVLGWVADRHPDLVRKIDARGHEVASHGYNHKLLYEQSREEVRRDFERSLRVLEPLVDGKVRGYRAPSFSMTDWAADLLVDCGFTYDSSQFVVQRHDRYGDLAIPDDEDGSFPTLDNGLTEVRMPLLKLSRFEFPWAGGGYFRVVPYPVFRRGVKRISSQRPFLFYMHPWELDPDQPKRTDIPLSYRFRHYTNLDKTARRLDRLLADFDWKPIGQFV